MPEPLALSLTVQANSSSKSTHKSPLRIIDPNSKKTDMEWVKEFMKNAGLQKREWVGKRALMRDVMLVIKKNRHPCDVETDRKKGGKESFYEEQRTTKVPITYREKYD